MTRHKTGNKETAIIEAAVKLFLEQGVRKTTMKQIAAQAGVAVGTVYLYYADKISIIRAVAFAFADQHRALVDQIAATSQAPLVKLQCYLLDLYDVWQPFGQNNDGSIDLAEAIMTHASETLTIAADQFHSAVSAFLSEAQEIGIRVDDPSLESKWIALATSPFYPLAGTPTTHPLRGQLQRKDLIGFTNWLASKYLA